MAVRINKKICDNADACGGIEACPTGAIFWDDVSQTLSTDDSKCTSCGVCEDACPIGAIMCAPDAESLKKIEVMIEADERKFEDLMVERYGAAPVDDLMQIEEDDIKAFIEKSAGLVFIEQNKDSTIACLLQSIPISQLREKIGKAFVYKKAIVNEERGGEYPRILIYNNAKKVGMVEGSFEVEQAEDLISAIEKMI